MKKSALFILLLLPGILAAQDPEKEIKSRITEVMVFVNHAQVTRTGEIQVPKGKSLIKLKGLSPYIDDRSIQVSATGNFTILSVNYELNYLQGTVMTKQVNDLVNKIEAVDDSINISKARIEVNKETLDMLNKNKKLGTETSGTDINQLRLAVRYYEQEIIAIKTEDIMIARKIRDFETEKTKLTNQLNDLNARLNQPTGEITISVQSDVIADANFRVSYLTSNAGWQPAYDIRAKDISSPVDLAYNANVVQNTGEDWDNVQLGFSNSNPSQSGTAPVINPWYLNFLEPRIMGYNKSADRSEVMQAMPSVAQGRAAGLEVEAAKEALSAGSTVVYNQTSFNFRVNIPYSVKSDGQDQKVELSEYKIPATYQYFAVPKLDKDAFLIARINDWDQYNLLPGEASLYFENTFIGRSYIDPAVQSDTMEISLGRDKSIIIERKKIDEFTQRKLIGTNKIDTRGFVISVRNNKSKPVELILIDQVPISTRSEIIVNPLETGGAVLDKEKGELKWKLQLGPQSQKEVRFQYEVRYPKNQRVILE